MNLKALPYIGIIGLFFGISVIVSRFALGQFHPLVFVSFRLALGTLAFLMVYLVAHKRYPFPTDLQLWKHALVLGIVGTAIPVSAFITSLQYQSSGVASIFVTTGPVLIVVMAHFILDDESLNPMKGTGVLLALSGALLLAIRGESGLPDVSQANPIGYALVLLSLFCHSTSTIYARKYTRRYAAFDVTSTQIIVGMVVVATVTGLTVGFDLTQVKISGVLVVLYGGLGGMFGAFWLYFLTLQRFGATEAAMSNYIVPIVATIGGVLFLNETITNGVLIGMTTILLGVALVNYGTQMGKVFVRRAV